MPSDPGIAVNRDVRLLVAAIVIAATVLVAVFTFGVDRPPELAELAADQAALPAVPIAWSSWSDNQQCVFIAETDGSFREVRCGLDGELAVFDSEGPLQLFSYGGGSGGQFTLTSIDRVSGEIIATETTDRDIEYEYRQVPTWFRDDGELVLRYNNADVWRVKSRESYVVFAARVSPDGAHIVVTDSAGRIILVTVSGAEPARIWVTGDTTRNRFGANQVLWEGESILKEPQVARQR